MWDELQSKHIITKIFKIEKTLASLVFRPTLQPLLYLTKSRDTFRFRYS